MVLTTTPGVPGKILEILGVVGAEARCWLDDGSGVRGPAIFEQGRASILARLAEEARALGADATVGIAFHVCPIDGGEVLITASGTAVRFLGPRR